MAKLFILVRKLHFFASAVIAVFLLMYFLTGAVMVMGRIFPRKNIVSVNEKVEISKNQSESEFVRELSSKYKIEGDRTITSNPRSGKNYTYTRPGYRAEIIFTEGKDSVQMRIIRGTVWSTMNDFHRIHGYSGGWSRKIWAVMYDLSCIALLVFALSGVYLWLKEERKKLAGIIILFISTGLTTFTIWYLMTIG